MLPPQLRGEKRGGNLNEFWRTPRETRKFGLENASIRFGIPMGKGVDLKHQSMISAEGKVTRGGGTEGGPQKE